MNALLSKGLEKLLDQADRAMRGGAPLLDTITWPREVEERFFSRGADELPEPSYEVDRPALEEKLRALDAFERELPRDAAIGRFLARRLESLRLGAQMVLAIGTRAFGTLSVRAYGGARGSSLDDDTHNLDFAEHLAARIGVDQAHVEPERETLSASEFRASLLERIEARSVRPAVEVMVDERLSAKVIAGKKRVRIRADARFSAEEARALYLHEVETHVFTAQNGDLQPIHVLDSGGPRSTRTQEGLAVFAEMYAKALTLPRLARLIERVRLVAKAEDGADFLELYRHLIGRGIDARAAFVDAARIFRGGIVAGGAPFTKDASYLGGFADVYNVLRIAIRSNQRTFAEVLVSGRLALDEMPDLLELREEGLLVAPRYVPSWLRSWDDLVVHFAFSSFLQEIDLRDIERRYPWLKRLARAS